MAGVAAYSGSARLNLRNQDLATVFTYAAMQKSWKRYVRDGLRRQSIADIHDYYDFDLNLKARCEQIRADILGGNYWAKPPHFVKLEKKLGITRRLVVPAAQDALVLQTITDFLLPKLKKGQPSKNAFFSRSHGFVPPQIKLDDEGEYFWFKRWIEFSKKKFEIASAFPFLCVTDIANYFDSIPFDSLRNVISSSEHIPEGVLDILFFTLNGVAWRPDYLPPTNRGLPQMHFDAPRLLAHVFLYEVDAYLKKHCDNKFVRWVDDISLAASSREEGKVRLKDLDELLHSRGLRLNTGKTVILDANEYKAFFYTEENSFLNVLKTRLERLRASDPTQYFEALQLLRKRFRQFWRSKKVGQWEKVLRRYVNLFAEHKDKYLVRFGEDILASHPTVRENYLRYLGTLGASKARFDQVEGFLISDHFVDDYSMFEAVSVLVSWKVTNTSALGKKIVRLGRSLGSPTRTKRNPSFFLAALNIASKYCAPKELKSVVDENKSVWKTSSYICRQVAAVLPRFYETPILEKEIASQISKYSVSEALAVLDSLNSFRTCSSISPKLRAYLRHGSKPNPDYPFKKALIALALLDNDHLTFTEKQQVAELVHSRSQDPQIKKLLAKWT